MKDLKQNLTQEEDLKFRIKFKEEYGIDYYEAVDNLNKTKQQSARDWNDLLMRIEKQKQ